MSTEISNANLQDAQLRAGIDRSLRHPVMFFLTSGAAWLAVSLILGIISSAKVHSPTFLDCCSFLTYGRTQAAHLNLLVYGWGFQVAFGVIIWLMSRLSRQTCKAAGLVLTAGHLWNLGVSLGVFGILFGYGTGIPWMEFPAFTWPVLLLSYIAILVWSFVQFKVRPEGSVYISQWYLMAAMLWFPWVFATANILIHMVPGNPVMAAGIAAWYKSAMVFLFFTPVALGTAFYLVPKVTGRPVQSYSMAKMGFWSLAVIMPWAGMQKLMGAPIPYFLPYLGAAATILFFIPALSAAVNLLQTASSTKDVVMHSPTLRFTMAGLFGLIVMAVCAAFINIPGSTLKLSQFSMSGYGFEILAIYAFFSFVMFGGIYFIVPRITRREWLSRRLIKMHFFISIYGIVLIALVAVFGGLQQGMGQEEFNKPWIAIAFRAYPYAWATTIAWCFILISNIFFFLHLLVMWLRLGRRSIHPTLLISDHGPSPHGEDGDIDNCGPGTVTPAH
jgi:cytochrome c oxidase cbb3-type subunit 1